MRHLAVGQACPMDGATVTRSHCSGCPSFVSFRAVQEVATVGCDWGDDVAGWLRREMSQSHGPLDGRSRAMVAARPAPQVRTAGPGAGVVGLFLAAFGVGIALSALERPY